GRPPVGGEKPGGRPPPARQERDCPEKAGGGRQPPVRGREDRGLTPPTRPGPHFQNKLSILIGADDLAAVDRAELDPGRPVDRVLDEVDGAVAKEAVDPTGVAGPRSRVLAPKASLVVAAQHLGGLAVAEGAGIGGDGGWSPASKDRTS